MKLRFLIIFKGVFRGSSRFQSMKVALIVVLAPIFVSFPISATGEEIAGQNSENRVISNKETLKRTEALLSLQSRLDDIAIHAVESQRTSLDLKVHLIRKVSLFSPYFVGKVQNSLIWWGFSDEVDSNLRRTSLSVICKTEDSEMASSVFVEIEFRLETLFSNPFSENIAEQTKEFSLCLNLLADNRFLNISDYKNLVQQNIDHLKKMNSVAILFFFNLHKNLGEKIVEYKLDSILSEKEINSIFFKFGGVFGPSSLLGNEEVLGEALVLYWDYFLKKQPLGVKKSELIAIFQEPKFDNDTRFFALNQYLELLLEEEAQLEESLSPIEEKKHYSLILDLLENSSVDSDLQRTLLKELFHRLKTNKNRFKFLPELFLSFLKNPSVDSNSKEIILNYLYSVIWITKDKKNFEEFSKIILFSRNEYFFEAIDDYHVRWRKLSAKIFSKNELLEIWMKYFLDPATRQLPKISLLWEISRKYRDFINNGEVQFYPQPWVDEVYSIFNDLSYPLSLREKIYNFFISETKKGTLLAPPPEISGGEGSIVKLLRDTRYRRDENGLATYSIDKNFSRVLEALGNDLVPVKDKGEILRRFGAYIELSGGPQAPHYFLFVEKVNEIFFDPSTSMEVRKDLYFLLIPTKRTYSKSGIVYSEILDGLQLDLRPYLQVFIDCLEDSTNTLEERKFAFSALDSYPANEYPENIDRIVFYVKQDPRLLERILERIEVSSDTVISYFVANQSLGGNDKYNLLIKGDASTQNEAFQALYNGNIEPSSWSYLFDIYCQSHDKNPLGLLANFDNLLEFYNDQNLPVSDRADVFDCLYEKVSKSLNHQKNNNP